MRPRAVVLMVAATLGGPAAVHPQAAGSAGSVLTLSVGVRDHHARDEMLSPLTYRGRIPALGLGYERWTGSSRHAVEAHAAIGGIAPRHAHLDQTGVGAHVAYGYGRRVGELTIFGRTAEIQAGGMWRSSAEAAFPRDWDNGAWLFAHAVNAGAAATTRLSDRSSLRVDVHVPLVAYVVRPPWAGFDEEVTENQNRYWTLLTSNGELVGPNRYLRVATRLHYRRDFDGRFDLDLRYRFFYERFDRPRGVESFAHMIAIGLAFTL